MNVPNVLALLAGIILPIVESQVIIRVYGKRGYRPGAIISILHVGGGVVFLMVGGAMVSKYAEAPITCPHVVTAIWVAITGVVLAAFGIMHFGLYFSDFIATLRRLRRV